MWKKMWIKNCRSIYRKHSFQKQLSPVRHVNSALFNADISLKHNAERNFNTTCEKTAPKFRQAHVHKLFNSERSGSLLVCKRGHVSYTERTHLCGELSEANIGEHVRLCGWVLHRRMVGMFLLIRDWTGAIQLTVPQEKSELSEQLAALPYESVVEVKGKVITRPPGQENPTMSTGEIEIEISSIEVLNKCREKLPIDIRDFFKNKEIHRMEYRYLDIRTRQMQHNLRLRSAVIMKMREFLCNQHGFVDVETPTLFRKTPGGAKEFVVPTRHSGKFYSLPQSPQQFKQLLMVGGIDRYFQIAKCYRDEGAKPDRQPEFTQVDIELSFTTQHEVLKLIEQLLQSSWPSEKGEITTPFPHMTYSEAMTNYGTDKPDVRFDMKLESITDIVEDSGVILFDYVTHVDNGHVIALRVPGAYKHLSRNEILKLQKTMQATLKSDLKNEMIIINDNGEWKSFISKHLETSVLESLTNRLKTEPNDVVVIATGFGYSPHEVLGRLRLTFADLLEQKGVKIRNKKNFNFLWVTDFPLFLKKENGDGLESAHHPFTAPHHEDIQLLYTDPEKVRSQHYDLVLNGSEIGGGSIRIHDSEVQRYVLENILKEDVSELEHLLEALELGCPPHGGIALGLDRLLAIMCGAHSIRDVIAFPKTQEGNDLMSKAPSKMSNEDLDLYHIQIKPTDPS